MKVDREALPNEIQITSEMTDLERKEAEAHNEAVKRLIEDRKPRSKESIKLFI